MSGGFFNYQNNSYAIDKLTTELKYIGNKYSPKTIEEFQKGLKILKEADVYLRRIDYLLSGDDGEESFHERLKEELKELKKEPPVEVKIPYCEICENYIRGRCVYAHKFLEDEKFRKRINRIIFEDRPVNSVQDIHRVFETDLKTPFKTVFKWNL